jgi:hypothetical protein
LLGWMVLGIADTLDWNEPLGGMEKLYGDCFQAGGGWTARSRSEGVMKVSIFARSVVMVTCFAGVDGLTVIISDVGKDKEAHRLCDAVQGCRAKGLLFILCVAFRHRVSWTRKDASLRTDRGSGLILSAMSI